MAFIFADKNRIISRYDGTQFQEEVLTLSGSDGITVTNDSEKFTISGSAVKRAGDTMTGALTLSGNPSANNEAANKKYVDDLVALETNLIVQEDNVTKFDGALQLDFGHALDVTSGTGEAIISVDEAELTNVVFLTGDQTISGMKFFANDAYFLGNIAVSGTQAILHTEQVLVEDNVITLNYTVTGAPTSPVFDAGIEVERGNLTNAMILWHENLDQWEAGISGALEKIILQSDLDAAVSGLAAVDSGLAGDISDLSGALSSGLGLKVDRAGDTMTGNLTLSSGISLLAAVSGFGAVGSAAAPFGNIYGDALYDDGNDPTASGQLANKQYVDSKVAGAAIVVNHEGAPVEAAALALDFLGALHVDALVPGTATISLKEDELTNVVFLTDNQTISGTKTFDSPIVLAAGVEPASISASGISGELRWADDYLYLATSSNSWKRVAIAQF